MKIQILSEPFVEVEYNDEALDDLLDRIAELPAVVAIANGIGKASYFRRYEPYNGVYDDKFLTPIAAAFLKGGLEKLDEDTDDFGNDPAEYYQEIAKRDLESALGAIGEALSQIDGLDVDEDSVVEELAEKLSETCIDAIADQDTSTLRDMFGSHDKVELSFFIDGDVLGVDDLHMERSHDVVFEPETARPNANLMRMFKLFNISPVAFVDYMLEVRGIDLTAPQILSEDRQSDWRMQNAKRVAAEWRTFIDLVNGETPSANDLSKLEDYEQRGIRAMADLALTVHDRSRPPAFSMEDLMTVMENAGGGGIATYTARYPINDIIDGKLNVAFVATGGFIGIHDFINGSGYVDRCEGQVLINPAVGGFTTRSIDRTYDNVRSYYYNETKAAPMADWSQISDDTWRSEVSKTTKQFAEIWIERKGDKTNHWVHTYDGLHDDAGLYAESELFSSFEEATEAGIEAIQMTPEELEAKVATGPKI